MTEKTLSSIMEESLLLACQDPGVETASQAYDFVLVQLELGHNQRPAVRRVKATLVKKLEYTLGVLK